MVARTKIVLNFADDFIKNILTFNQTNHEYKVCTPQKNYLRIGAK